MKNNTWVRDTLIRLESYEKLSETKQKRIDELIAEFQKIPYVDVRTELGPDQARRMSQAQKKKMQYNAQRVWQIETEIKTLLTPDEVIQAWKRNKEAESLKSDISRAERYINDVLSMSTSYKKNGELKIGYRRGVDHHQEIINEAKLKLDQIMA